MVAVKKVFGRIHKNLVPLTGLKRDPGRWARGRQGEARGGSGHGGGRGAVRNRGLGAGKEALRGREDALPEPAPSDPG